MHNGFLDMSKNPLAHVIMYVLWIFGLTQKSTATRAISFMQIFGQAQKSAGTIRAPNLLRKMGNGGFGGLGRARDFIPRASRNAGSVALKARPSEWFVRVT